MFKFRIFETAEFSKRLQKILGSNKPRMEKKLRIYVYPQLNKQPHYGNNIKKLRDYAPETWRYRVGDYRFFYEIDNEDRIVYMTSVSHRKDSY